MKQHKWHKEIKAWADGAEIEYSVGQEWNPTSHPTWEKFGMVYRIKPQPKEPQYLYAWTTKIGISITKYKDDLPSQYKYIGKIKLKVDDD